jgi:alpha-galactosidase
MHSRFCFCGASLCAVLLACLPAIAGDASLAPTPPMGWNSWDSYGRTITEAQVKANAHWMAKNLKRFGWKYVVIDEGWYIGNPDSTPQDYEFALSDDGRFIPASIRFPSATNNAGFQPLGDYIHSLGLKFGIHIIRGIPRQAVTRNLPIADSSYHATDAADPSDTCPWNDYNYGVKDSDAGQAYYDSIIKLYASWHVDFIKVDCLADHPYKPDEIRMLANAIKKTGRPIVLSLSPGPTALDHAAEVSKYAEMWRICDDFWDHWGVWEKHEFSQGLRQQFATTAKWATHVAPGSWPDADMLPLGHLGPHPGDGELRETRLTKDEQRTMVTLWSIFRSPLIMGGDLTSADKWTESLLTNSEVIAVDQFSYENHAVISNDTTAIWVARRGPSIADEHSHGRSYYLAVFNIGDKEQTIHYEWKDLELSAASYKVRDLWERKNAAPAPSLTVRLQPHASVLYELTGKQ